jgi:hypothetical protein
VIVRHRALNANIDKDGITHAGQPLRSTSAAVSLQNRGGELQVSDEPYCHGLAVRPDELEVWALCGVNLYIHSASESAFQEIAHISFATQTISSIA